MQNVANGAEDVTVRSYAASVQQASGSGFHLAGCWRHVEPSYVNTLCDVGVGGRVGGGRAHSFVLPFFKYTHMYMYKKKGGTVCSVEVQSGSPHFSTADSVISTHAHIHTHWGTVSSARSLRNHWWCGGCAELLLPRTHTHIHTQTHTSFSKFLLPLLKTTKIFGFHDGWRQNWTKNKNLMRRIDRWLHSHYMGESADVSVDFQSGLCGLYETIMTNVAPPNTSACVCMHLFVCLLVGKEQNEDSCASQHE